MMIVAASITKGYAEVSGNIPGMFFYQNSRNGRVKLCTLSVAQCVWEFRTMHHGIFFNTPCCFQRSDEDLDIPNYIFRYHQWHSLPSVKD